MHTWTFYLEVWIFFTIFKIIDGNLLILMPLYLIAEIVITLTHAPTSNETPLNIVSSHPTSISDDTLVEL